MKVIIYSRVSTDDKEQNTERQVIQCRNYCAIHNHTIIGEHEDYISGDTNPFIRKGFSSGVKSKPDGIVIYEISRFSREHPSKVMRRIQELKDSGIKIISITEPAFNMEGDMSELLQYIMAWFNNYYLSNLRRNVKTGQERARQQGKVIGRAKVKFNERRATHLYTVEKKTQREIAKELNVSLGTLNRFLKTLK
jgi:DNA invertase Pin-like site-specific DNA recombinase